MSINDNKYLKTFQNDNKYNNFITPKNIETKSSTISPKRLYLRDDITMRTNKAENLSSTNNALLSDNLNNIFDKLNQININEQQSNLKKIVKQKSYREDKSFRVAEQKSYVGEREEFRNLKKRNKIVNLFY
jgi:hypothetical protein